MKEITDVGNCMTFRMSVFLVIGSILSIGSSCCLDAGRRGYGALALTFLNVILIRPSFLPEFFFSTPPPA